MRPSTFSRFIWGLWLAAATVLAEASPNFEKTLHPVSGRSLYDVVKSYTNIGNGRIGGIRTGTVGARKVFLWLRRELKRAGLLTTQQHWRFRQYALRRCELIVDGQAVDCLPMWFPNTTRLNNLGISHATLLPGQAAVVQIRGYQQDNTGVGPIIEGAVSKGAGAVIAVNTVHQSLTAINAIDTTSEAPRSVPIVVVGNKDASLLGSAKKVDTLRLLGRNLPAARTANLIGRLPRHQQTQKLIVVSTPINGWFLNGGERGPGVALFLGLARWAAMTRPAADFVFVATSGHELGEMGSKRFLDGAERLGVTPDKVTAWIHLGASIATWNYAEHGNGHFEKIGTYHANLDYNSPMLAPLLTDYLMPPGFNPKPESTKTAGELAMIMDRGYKAFGFYGAFGKFHTRFDLADSTAPELLEPVARALTNLIDAIVAAP